MLKIAVVNYCFNTIYCSYGSGKLIRRIETTGILITQKEFSDKMEWKKKGQTERKKKKEKRGRKSKITKEDQ